MASMDSRDLNNEGKITPFSFQRQDEALLLLSLQEFDAQLPTEEDARENVKIRLEKENLLFCHDCNSHNLEKKYGARVLKCLDCNGKTWVTAGTFFHHAKRLKPRLAAIWLMEHGFIVSSSKLHKLTNVAQSSAFNILKRVAIVIEAHMERNISEIPSAVFSKVMYKRSRETPARAHPLAEQEELDALENKKEQEEEEEEEEEERQQQQQQQEQEQKLQKRLQKDLLEKYPKEPSTTEMASLQEELQEELSVDETALLQEHSSALNITDSAGTTDLTGDTADLTKNAGNQSHQTNMSMQDSTYNQLSQQEKILYDLLSEEPVSFEELYIRSNMSVANATASLVMLEIAGLASCLPGNNYIRSAGNKNSQNSIKNKANNEALAKFEPIALLIESFIRSNFHGISRKYLQTYLSTYWYCVDKNFWQLDSLLNACFRFRPVKLTEIISYITPPTIKYCAD